nr:hypothetical protein [Cellulosimicrobium sp. MM]
MPGPDDHVKVFLPDPATGSCTPRRYDDGALQRPTGVVRSPRADRPGDADRRRGSRGRRRLGAPRRTDRGAAHRRGGPASAGRTGAVGDEVVLAGPTTSRAVPDGVGRLLLVGTSGPSRSRAG